MYYTLYSSIMVYLVSYYVFAQFKLFDDYKNSWHIGLDNNLLTITFDWILWKNHSLFLMEKTNYRVIALNGGLK